MRRLAKGALGAALLLSVLAGLMFVLAPSLARRLGHDLFGGYIERAQAPIRLATAGPRGAYHELGDALRDRLEGRTDLQVHVLDTNGSLDNIGRLQRGEADFAFIQGALDVDLTGLAAVARIQPQYVNLLVPVDSSIRTFGDLAGKRLGVGPADSDFADLGRRMVDFFHFAPALELVFTPTDRMRSALDAGEVDALLTVFSLYAPWLTEILDTGGYRLAPIVEARAIASYLPGTQASAIPVNAYGPNRSIPPSAAGPLPTLAVDMLLVTRADASPLYVRTILDAIYDVSFAKAAHLTEFNETGGRAVFDLPLHAAADAYYRRNDPLTSDRFEIASFFLAGLVCLASAIQYLRERKRRRIGEGKRRAIMPYFEALLTFGSAVENSGDRDEVVSILNSMMTTQRRAEQEWLEGKLDTEHMENLYSLYNIRSRNAFNKILKLHLSHLSHLLGVLQRTNVVQESPPEQKWTKSSPRSEGVGSETDELSGIPTIVLPPRKKDA